MVTNGSDSWQNRFIKNQLSFNLKKYIYLTSTWFFIINHCQPVTNTMNTKKSFLTNSWTILNATYFALKMFFDNDLLVIPKTVHKFGKYIPALHPNWNIISFFSWYAAIYNRRGRLILGGFKKTLVYSEYHQFSEFEVTAGSVTNEANITHRTS